MKSTEVENRIPVLILDSWNKPVVFVDTNHTIQYMNRAARRHYAKWGNTIGKSIFDCHNQNSRKIIEEAFKELAEGEEEIMIVNSARHRVYMKSVTDEKGEFIGYYERYDPPE